jgi:NADH dehydrogenase
VDSQCVFPLEVLISGEQARPLPYEGSGLIGGGKTLFQPIYVGDVVKAIQIAMIPTAQVQGKIFELGGAEKISFKECLIKMMSYTGIKKPLITIPFWLAKIQGTVLQRLPGKLLTLDQVKSLTVDNCVSGNLPTLEDLNSVPTPMDIILPTYLSRYRVGGRFATRHQNKAGL